MSLYTRLRFVDPKMTMRRLAELAESGFAGMSSSDIANTLHVMDKQGIQSPDMALYLSKRCWNHSEGISRGGIMRSLSNMNISTPQSLSEGFMPDSVEDWINSAFAVILNPDMMRNEQIVEKYVMGALDHISRNPIVWKEYSLAHSQKSRDIQIIRHSLLYFHTEWYAKASNDMKASLALTSAQTCQPTNPQRSSAPAARFVGSLSSALLKLRVAHATNTTVGPFCADLIERDAKIIWQCNGPNRYFAQANPEKRLRPYHALQSQILTGMGYTVIPVPHWQWDNMKNHRTRIDYCRTNRYLACHDVRGAHPQYPAGGDPSYFDARMAVASLISFGNNQGETFFKKAAPKRSWIWSRPQISDTPLRVSI